MPVERVQLSEFTIDKPGGRRSFRGVSAKKNGGRHRGASASSMLMKIGLCAFMCAIILLLSALQNNAESTHSAYQDPSDDGFDESLGKLKFVELPGILEVFATSGKLAVDVSYDAVELIGDDTTLVLVSATAQTVSLPVNGRVKAVGEDAKLGSYVCVTTANDSELQYYGISGISVEEGQTLKALDSLGVIEAGETLFIKVNKSGRPENPAEYFELGEGELS